MVQNRACLSEHSDRVDFHLLYLEFAMPVVHNQGFSGKNCIDSLIAYAVTFCYTDDQTLVPDYIVATVQASSLAFATIRRQGWICVPPKPV